MSKDFDPRKNYKLAEIYVARDPEGRLLDKPNWYVYYFLRHPATGEWIMRKKTEGINRIKNLKLRLKEAKKLQTAINIMLVRGYNPLEQSESNYLVLKNAIELFKSEHLSKLKRRTYTTYSSSVAQLLKYFVKIGQPNVSVTQIDRDQITAALNYWFRLKKWENRQYNNSLARWRGFFNFLISQNIIERNPTDHIKFLKVYPTDRNRPPTESEFETIVNHLYKNDKPLFLYAMIIYYQGFRVTETGNLRRSQIEFDTEHPFFRLPAKMQKDNEDVIQYVSPHLLKYFLEFGIDKLPSTNYLFSSKLSPGTKRINKMKDIVEKRWRDVVKAGLGIPVDLYSMKHKQATELGEKTETKEISKWARHSSEEVTRIYMKRYRPVTNIEFYKNQRPLPIKLK